MNKHTTGNNKPGYCETFTGNLDNWLEGELAEDIVTDMQLHLDSCPKCVVEYRLAQKVLQTTRELPELDWSAKIIVVERDNFSERLKDYFSPLIQLWRRPALMLPTLLVVAVTSILVFELFYDNKPGEVQPELAGKIIIDGKEYSQNEVNDAIADFVLAMDYLDKYARYTTGLVEAELMNKKNKEKGENSDNPTDDDAI